MKRAAGILALSAAILLPAAALAQSSREQRRKQRELKRRIQQALREFRKTYTKSDVERAKAMEKLAEFNSEEVLKELAKFTTADTSLVRQKAISILVKKNHPIAVDALAKAWEANLAEDKIIELLIKSIPDMPWDAYLQGSFILFKRDVMLEKNHNRTALTGLLLQMLQKVRSIVAVEPLVGLLKVYDKVMEDNEAAGGDNTGWEKGRKEILELLRGLTGQSFESTKEWEKWLPRNLQVLEMKCIHVMWCEHSWKFWEKLPNDKRRCPHHQDQRRPRGREILARKKPR